MGAADRGGGRKCSKRGPTKRHRVLLRQSKQALLGGTGGNVRKCVPVISADVGITAKASSLPAACFHSAIQDACQNHTRTNRAVCHVRGPSFLFHRIHITFLRLCFSERGLVSLAFQGRHRRFLRTISETPMRKKFEDFCLYVTER